MNKDKMLCKFIRYAFIRQEFVNYVEGDSSVGISGATIEQGKEAMLKRGYSKKTVLKIYKELKKKEGEVLKQDKENYKEWKKSMKEEVN